MVICCRTFRIASKEFCQAIPSGTGCSLSLCEGRFVQLNHKCLGQYFYKCLGFASQGACLDRLYLHGAMNLACSLCCRGVVMAIDVFGSSLGSDRVSKDLNSSFE